MSGGAARGGGGRRPVRLLRSRRLAVALLVTVGGLSAVGTLPGWEGWYRHPVYLAAFSLLTASTAICAWERTVGAIRGAKDPGAVDEALAKRIRERPQWAGSAEGLDADAVSRALAAAGLKVRRGPALSVGYAGRWGLVGSPLFHWSLVALFIVIALGQATLSSGLIGIALGESVAEEAESYGLLDTGPLFSGHTGWDIAVEAWDREYVIDGIDRGPVPTVAVYDEGRLLGRQRVYANAPLRIGTAFVHYSDWGLAARTRIESPEGETLATRTMLVDFEEGDPNRTVPSAFEYAGEDGRPWVVTLRLAPPQEGDATAGSTEQTVVADALVQAGPPDDAPGTEARLDTGSAMALPDGNVLRYDGATYYARLSFVRDWSILPIYVLLGTATLGLVIALLVPFRAAWVLLRRSEDGTDRVHVVIRHVRRDPIFTDMVVGMLTEQAGKETER